MTTTAARIRWKGLQIIVWLAGVAIVVLSAWQPDIGIDAFWNVLIPAAPALLVIAPGVWRNICPIASTALYSRKSMAVGGRRRLSVAANNRLLLGGVALLFLIIPLRHVIFDRSGPATALLLLLVTGMAVALCLRYEWKSSWCSGLCPVHPVEKLYGTKSMVSPMNAHCLSCERCVEVCADSSQGFDPLTASNRSWARTLAGLLMFGFFPGYIYGWFHVPDYLHPEGWHHTFAAYRLAAIPGFVTLASFLIAVSLISKVHRASLYRVFAAATVSCYYWYRLPALFGYGPFPADGTLVDLTATLPSWWVAVSRISTTGFFLWWMLGRPTVRRSWCVRPAFADGQGRLEGPALGERRV